MPNSKKKSGSSSKETFSPINGSEIADSVRYVKVSSSGVRLPSIKRGGDGGKLKRSRTSNNLDKASGRGSSSSKNRGEGGASSLNRSSTTGSSSTPRSQNKNSSGNNRSNNSSRSGHKSSSSNKHQRR